ncbi:MAG: primosomal protein N' [Pseudobdellovibrionaceae bacterium]
MTPESFCFVATDSPIAKALTYKFSQPEILDRGQSVIVPLGARKVRGIVLGSTKDAPKTEGFEFKAIDSIDLEYPKIPEKTLAWMEWVSSYYMHPIGQVCQLAFPPLSRATQARKSSRPNVVPNSIMENPVDLTDEQEQIIKSVLKHKTQETFSAHLIYGVTGSGKTEIYLRLIDDTLKRGQSALFLVPEIALTPQLVQRFVNRFGPKVAVLHSQLTDRERTNQWWEIISGDRKILIGARSALFCPVGDLGLIVVDEEHESSYKQDEKLKYHGRDCAIMLAKFHEIPVLLGSATPSLESWKNTVDNKFYLHRLTKRVHSQAMPQMTVVDMKEEAQNTSGLPNWLSQTLHQKMNEVLGKKLQVALLLNRRGVAPVVMCKSCGFISKCPNCEISLTLHSANHLVCHYCDYNEKLPEKCSDCGEDKLEALGIGTEQVEDDLKQLYPDLRIARADRDEIQNRLEMEELVEKMEKHEIDILVGTQMIAKGLDFKDLFLVGFVLADVGFQLPDFRATERGFQLITQMSGRAGRHPLPDGSLGEVVIQTYQPDHPSIVYALNFTQAEIQTDQGEQKDDFYSQELNSRQELGYPPFSRMICFRIQGPDLVCTQQTSLKLKHRAESLKQKKPQYESIQVLGPVAAPLAKLRGNHRYQMLVKAASGKTLNHFAQQVLGDQKWIRSKSKIIVDVDPQHLL